jgi:serine/threonine protein kinase
MKKIGEGGSGKIYLAVRKDDGSKCAVKVFAISILLESASFCLSPGLLIAQVIDREEDEIIRAEVALMRRASGHPNITTLLDCFVTGTDLWMVMEFMPGG